MEWNLFMLKKSVASLFVALAVSSAFADNSGPNFVIMPNIKTQYLMSTNALQVVDFQKNAIELVKNLLNINSASPYRGVRLQFIYNNKNQVEAILVYLLSNKTKSYELIKITVTPALTYLSMERPYHLKSSDLSQLPAYANPKIPRCPDPAVQFAIGNNFKGDVSVETEVQKVYKLAQANGYNPILMDVNDSNTPQPTIQAYLNWMSCPNLKGFYNESHGSTEDILLSDGDFTYTIIQKNLKDKLKSEIVLFDSCDTFNDPLLSTMVNTNQADSQQYIAGIVPLPFGSSERTASCFWAAALQHQELTQALIENCALQYNLDKDAFRIGGSGDDHLDPVTG
jgi:hypothetical protein